ncbi:hypothetical protein GCM10007938_27400 [Vibrio zhanjiangensis]|uniref:Uncharacterized protein n=1 Tax=Vibrio zhanjiangensis TaxID=1046128 RepID=A0ABQ6F0E5_9VIBR|nr:hypothetical protein [Vibrio zhanjiangensis]GLT18958.1 hypothetical protein GCM10007938_27400 [Vibrio zhanjiangensis]
MQHSDMFDVSKVEKTLNIKPPMMHINGVKKHKLVAEKYTHHCTEYPRVKDESDYG